MIGTKPKRDRVFISYSHADQKWLKRLQVYLKPLSRIGKVDWWDDTKITPGSKWREEIQQALESAKVAVLLISADFIASDFIAEYELPALLKAAETESATILPVIVSPSNFAGNKTLAEFQAVNDPSRTLVEMSRGERERLWGNLIDRIQAALSGPGVSDTSNETSNAPDFQWASIGEGSLILLDLMPAVGVFIDRQEHVKAIRDFIADDARRLVIVQGLPGIGKTTLAAKVIQEVQEQYKAVLWITCKADQESPDILFAKLNTFFEEHGEPGLRGLWNDPRPGQLETKINRLIHILDRNPYLLTFDDFQNWLSADFRLKNAGLRQILSSILSSAHRSKVILISDQRPLLDPANFRLPVGSKLEFTLLGLDKVHATQLLFETGLITEDQELLSRIIDHCDGNPYMLQIFSYLVTGLHREPQRLLTSRETGTEFSQLLQAVTKDLSEESRRNLELLSILRFPLQQEQMRALDPPFDTGIGPLLDRFLVVEDIRTQKFHVATVIREFIKGTLSDPRLRELHKQAAEIYMSQCTQTPRNYTEVQLALEESYHRFQQGDSERAARVILSVTQLLIDWGYIELAEQNILQVLNNTQNHELIAPSVAYLGCIADLRSDYPKALGYFEQALQLYEAAHDHNGIAKTSFRIGRIYNGRAEFDRANEYFQRCIQTCDEYKVMDGLAASLLGMGWNLQQSDNIERALELYEQSIERAEQSNDFETLSSAQRQIGFLLWTERGKIDEAKKRYEKALQVSEEHNLVQEIGAVHTTLGYLYNEWDEYDKAEESCQQAIQIFKATGNKYGISNAYLNLGGVFESKQDLESAVRWYKQSRDISLDIRNAGGQAYACLRLARVLKKQNRFEDGRAFLLEAIELSETHALLNTLSAAKELLSQMNNR